MSHCQRHSKRVSSRQEIFQEKGELLVYMVCGKRRHSEHHITQGAVQYEQTGELAVRPWGTTDQRRIESQGENGQLCHLHHTQWSPMRLNPESSGLGNELEVTVNVGSECATSGSSTLKGEG